MPCLLLMVVGCAAPGSPGQPAASSPTPEAPARVVLADVVEGVFAPSCSTRSCHGAQGAQGNLVLVGDDLRERLVDREPWSLEASGRGWRLVVPGEPDRSWLLIKMEGPPVGGGGRMPVGRAPDPSQLALVRAWIAQGALP